MRSCLLVVRGAFALAAMDATEPDVIVAARRISPAGRGHRPGRDLPGERRARRSSTAPAAFYAVNDDEVVRLGPEGFRAVDLDGAPVRLRQLAIDWDLETAQKGGHDDFMIKEINEQPDALRATLADRRRDDGTITFDELRVSDDELRDVRRVVIVAAGTSYHAALVAKYAFERWAQVSTSRSTSRASTATATRSSRSGPWSSGSPRAARRSTRSRRCARPSAAVRASSPWPTSWTPRWRARPTPSIYTRAGLEVSVASTKAYVAQVAALELLALRLAQLRGTLSSPADVEALFLGLARSGRWCAGALERRDEGRGRRARARAGPTTSSSSGRHVGFPTALEGALKFKEVTYLHAEGYPAGELKHGPLALIEPGVIVVAVATDPAMHEKMLSNLSEVKARGASVVARGHRRRRPDRRGRRLRAARPATEPLFAPMVDVVPLQLFAYTMARRLGRNVDRPRNLAKTVTVE